MIDRDYVYTQIESELAQIPGINPVEIEIAARILVYVDPVRPRTDTEQALLSMIFERGLTIVQVDTARKSLIKDVDAFVSFVHQRDKSLTLFEALLIASATIYGLPEIFQNSSDLLNFLDDAINRVKQDRTKNENQA